MSFQYKNPTSSTIIYGPVSVDRDNDTGVIFSVNSIGGYMEVWSLADLDWVISVEEMNQCTNAEFLWVKDLTLIDYEPKPSPPLFGME